MTIRVDVQYPASNILVETEVLEAPPVGASIFPLDMVKTHLRLDDDTIEDDLLAHYIKAATEYVEAVCSMSILPRVMSFRYPHFPRNGRFELHVRPVRSVMAVNYTDHLTGDNAVVPNTEYRVLTSRTGAALVPLFNKNWPQASARIDYHAVEVIAEVGYTPTGDDYGIAVPSALKEAILLTIGDYYENREAAGVSTRIFSSMFDNKAFRRLIANYRLRRA